jgi:hypothetical protein
MFDQAHQAITACLTLAFHVQEERSGGRTLYRLAVAAAELMAGAAAVGATISRTRRLRLEALHPSARDTPFVCDDVLALLFVTDEDARAVAASVDSHYGAAKPELPFRVVLIAEAAGEGSAARRAYDELRSAHTNLLLFTKEELAQQARPCTH